MNRLEFIQSLFAVPVAKVFTYLTIGEYIGLLIMTMTVLALLVFVIWNYFSSRR